MSRAFSIRDVVGAQILVQSPNKCASYIRNSLDKHLVNMLEKVSVISDEEFETQKASVLIKLQKRNRSMYEEYKQLL
jgi:secreted Zn-dependent insulinase-like peptidase